MRVHFHNSSGVTVQIAIMRYAPDACGGDGGNWLVEGWWPFIPGNEVFPFETNNIYFYFYAEDTEGLGKIWSGNYGPAYVLDSAFSNCFNIGTSTARLVGMQEVNTGQLYDDYTVTLNP